MLLSEMKGEEGGKSMQGEEVQEGEEEAERECLSEVLTKTKKQIPMLIRLRNHRIIISYLCCLTWDCL
jgi:hypothetical protein